MRLIAYVMQGNCTDCVQCWQVCLRYPQERNSCAFKYHTVILFVAHGCWYDSITSMHVVGVLDRGDNMRQGYVLRLGLPLPGN